MKLTLTEAEAFLTLCAMESEVFTEAAESLPEAAESLRAKLARLSPYTPFRTLSEAQKAGFCSL